MTLTADTATPAASEQPKCPAWCTNHHPDAEIHRTPRAETDFWKSGIASWISVTGLDYCQDDGPEVSISGWRQVFGTGERTSPNVVLPLVQAAQIADLVEILQNATPGQHCEIAAAIRQAAAQIAEPSGG